jgi:hypothetical protein
MAALVCCFCLVLVVSSSSLHRSPNHPPAMSSNNDRARVGQKRSIPEYREKSKFIKRQRREQAPRGSRDKVWHAHRGRNYIQHTYLHTPNAYSYASWYCHLMLGSHAFAAAKQVICTLIVPKRTRVLQTDQFASTAELMTILCVRAQSLSSMVLLSLMSMLGIDCLPRSLLALLTTLQYWRLCADERRTRCTGGATYATCFICKQQGHLSSRCPKSSHGLYPNGGCCHVCNSKDHRYRDCPDRLKTEDGEERSFVKTSRKFAGTRTRFGSPEPEGKTSGGDDDANVDGDFQVADEDAIGSVPLHEARRPRPAADSSDDERKGKPARIVAGAGDSRVKVVKTKTQRLKQKKEKEESKKRQLAKAMAEKTKKSKPVKEVAF